MLNCLAGSLLAAESGPVVSIRNVNFSTIAWVCREHDNQSARLRAHHDTFLCAL